MPIDRTEAVVERLACVVREELRAVASAHGLALAQLEALRFLAQANRFSDTVTGLVEYLGTTKGTLSQTVSSLERKGLVVRTPDPKDRRVQHCGITSEGQAIVDACSGSRDLAGRLDARDLAVGLEGVLRDVLRARGGRGFGVCETCLHHRRAGEGRRCLLLGVALTTDDASRICIEHTGVDR